eukprot:5718794-Pleurochrysis_carterae.AAC.2
MSSFSYCRSVWSDMSATASAGQDPSAEAKRWASNGCATRSRAWRDVDRWNILGVDFARAGACAPASLMRAAAAKRRAGEQGQDEKGCGTVMWS